MYQNIYRQKNGGFIKSILIVITGVIILGIFGVDLKDTLSEGKIHDNLVYVWELAKQVWMNYIERPINFVWGIFYNDVWLSFFPGLVDKIKEIEFFNLTLDEITEREG